MLEEDGITLTGTQSASFPVNSVFATGIDFFPNANALNLTLQFDQDVTIQSLSFGEVNGSMTFSVAGGDTFAAAVGTVSLPDEIFIAANTPFIINGTGTGSNYAELNGITVVPEPAGVALAAGGLVLLVLRRRIPRG